jgi:hypothetical protein
MILLIAAIALIVMGGLIGLNYRYWLKPPHEKFAESWKRDYELIMSTPQAERLKSIKQIEIKTDSSPVQEWISQVKPPVIEQPSGKFKLALLILHQINENRYGVMIQYTLVDLESGNTVDEFARTLKLGVYY